MQPLRMGHNAQASGSFSGSQNTGFIGSSLASGSAPTGMANPMASNPGGGDALGGQSFGAQGNGQQPDMQGMLFGMMAMMGMMMIAMLGVVSTLMQNRQGSAGGPNATTPGSSVSSGAAPGGDTTPAGISPTIGNQPVADNISVPPGGAVTPLDPSMMTLDSPFGAPRDGGARSHEGNDFFAPRGTPVRSMKDGVILRMRNSDMPGYYIVIKHDDGTYTKYMHLQDFASDGIEGLQDGSRVNAGQVIGRVSDTGNARAAGPHLHFEIHQGGEDNPVNPWPILQALLQNNRRA